MKVNYFKILLAAFGIGFAFTSCSEDIDTSNRYTFTGETVKDYIANREDFSEYYRLIQKVPLSDFSKSSVAQLLSARGNFVVFAPTNQAIATYLSDSCGAKRHLVPDTLTSTQYLDNEALADSLDRIIVYNSIINRGDLVNTFWYIGDMCRDRYSELPVANMNGRYLTVENPTFEYDSLVNAEVEKCRVSCGDMVWDIRNRDAEVFNGVVQEMNGVVAPSNANIFEILTTEDSPFTVWASLMEKTGVAAELTDPKTAFEDYEYKQMYEEGVANFNGAVDEGGYYTVQGVGTEGSRSILPAERKFGFTIFAESDEVMRGLGINGADEASLKTLANKLQELGAPGVNDENYASEENIVHQWLTYHILPMRMNYDQLVVHWNEQGYTPYAQSKAPTIPVSEWYQTYGKPYRVLKLSEGRYTDGMRINRFWKNNPEAKSINDFELELYKPGIFVSKVNTQALNGLVYQIDELLVYTEEVAQRMGNERIRFDIASLVPELITNNLRRLTVTYPHGRNLGFSVKNKMNKQFFDRFISNNAESRINYLPGVNSNWRNMQGDEFNVEGSFDLTIQLPPVPTTGTYELRYGVSANNMRTMCQVYFGSDPARLPATGIPMDLRTGGVNRYAKTTQASNLGWVADVADETVNQENDKILRNNGYMKAPATYLLVPASNFSVGASLRESSPDGLRCILVRANMEAGKLYYVRFKDVLGNDKAQFFFDYMELCPKSVYDNPNQPEDKW